jgi:hypothetical protein
VTRPGIVRVVFTKTLQRTNEGVVEDDPPAELDGEHSFEIAIEESPNGETHEPCRLSEQQRTDANGCTKSTSWGSLVRAQYCHRKSLQTGESHLQWRRHGRRSWQRLAAPARRERPLRAEFLAKRLSTTSLFAAVRASSVDRHPSEQLRRRLHALPILLTKTVSHVLIK